MKRLYVLILILSVTGLAFAVPTITKQQPVPGPEAKHQIAAPARFALPPVGSRNPVTLDEVIISEGFESYNNGTLPPGWLQVDVDNLATPAPGFNGQSEWQVLSGSGYAAHSGSKFVANAYNQGGAPNNDWLILPQQTLTGTITLSYWVSSQDPLYLESYEVRVSTTGTQPADFTDLVADVNDTPNPWTERTHDLSEYAGQAIYIAFHYDAVDEFVIKIDDLLLEADGAAPRGAIAGLVTNDVNQTPLPGIRVEVVGEDLVLNTNAEGRYLFPAVNPGTYSVLFTNALFDSVLITDVAVAASETTVVDVEMHAIPTATEDYMSSAAAVPVVDGDTARMAIDIPDDRAILDLDVTVNVTHTYAGDLAMWLESPVGDRVTLVLEDISRSGENYTNTRFDDEATEQISDNDPPFTGSFQPAEPLSEFDFLSSAGTWELIVLDNFAEDGGTLDNFTLHVTYPSSGDAGEPGAALPQAFTFHGSYPNPFNAVTTFRFALARTAGVELVLYNVAGQEAARVVDGVLPAGEHAVAFSADHLPSGLYFARLTAGGQAITRKIALLK